MTDALTAPRLPRWFYKCPDCCTVCAIDGRQSTEAIACSCGGKLEVMGRVKDNRLTSMLLHQSPCDHSCCFAQGPNCDCSCGGANHGSGVTVTVVKDEGAIPRIVATDDGKRTARAAEFKMAYAEVKAKLEAHRIGGVRASLARGEWVASKVDWNLAKDFGERLAKIRKMRTHGGRLRAIVDLAKRLEAFK